MSAPLRVLHVHSGNIYGGLETFLITLARFRAMCPTMIPGFALSFEARLSRELRTEGVPVHQLGEVRARHPWTMAGARRRLRRLVEAGNYDVAVTHSTWSQSILAPALRRRSVPHALYLHELVSLRHWVEWTARWTPPDLVLCNSRHTAETSFPMLYRGVPSAVLYCASNPAGAVEPGTRERLRSGLGTSLQAAVIVQVSRLEEWKGHRLHLEALGLLRDVPGWECWIVGGAQHSRERAYLAELTSRAVQLGLADRVRFLGQRSDVPALLAAADVHCQPNTGPEPFGLTFIEALSAGLPVVSTAMGGALEIVDPSCGLLTAPDPGALSAALRRMLTDADLRRRLGEAGPARARALCDPSRQLMALEGHLRELALRKI